MENQGAIQVARWRPTAGRQPLSGYRYALPALRQTREARELSGRGLAFTVGMPVQTLSRVERREIRCSPENQEAIAGTLGIPVLELFAEDEGSSRRLSERRERVRQLYAEGHSSVEIARLERIDKGTVLKDLDVLDPTRRERRQRTIPRERLEVVRRLYVDERRAPQAIAEELGISRTLVRMYLDRLGVTRRTRSDAKRKYPLPEPRSCERCGETFKPEHPCEGGRQFCSRKCARASERMRADARDGAREQHKAAREALGAVKADAEWRTVDTQELSALIGRAPNTISGKDVPAGRLKAEKRMFGNEYRLLFSLDQPGIPGRARQVHLGRKNGYKGAAAGIESGRAKGGRKTTLTPEQQQKIIELDKEQRSTREIAEQVLGDRSKHLRVWRHLNR